jgi:Tropinone reductase 1
MSFASRWRLDGQVALVTGGTKGIGRATVEELCLLGASVFTCARDEGALAESLAEWRARGLSVEGVACDVSDGEQRKRLVEACSAHFGGALNILFCNAGTNVRKATVDYSEADFLNVLGLNFSATYNLVQLVHPLLLAAAARGQGASVVFNSSVAGVVAISSGTVYAASKAALNQLARNLACEWGRQGVRVNAVAPWYTVTCAPAARNVSTGCV